MRVNSHIKLKLCSGSGSVNVLSSTAGPILRPSAVSETLYTPVNPYKTLMQTNRASKKASRKSKVLKKTSLLGILVYLG